MFKRKKEGKPPEGPVPLSVQGALAKFEEARSILKLFTSDPGNAKVLEDYHALLASYNEATEEVATEYRANYDQIGSNLYDFQARRRTEVDPYALSNLLGPAAIEKGVLRMELVLDRKKYNELVESGDIPQEVADRVTTQLAPAIEKPKATFG